MKIWKHSQDLVRDIPQLYLDCTCNFTDSTTVAEEEWRRLSPYPLMQGFGRLGVYALCALDVIATNRLIPPGAFNESCPLAPDPNLETLLPTMDNFHTVSTRGFLMDDWCTYSRLWPL